MQKMRISGHSNIELFTLLKEIFSFFPQSKYLINYRLVYSSIHNMECMN